MWFYQIAGREYGFPCSLTGYLQSEHHYDSLDGLPLPIISLPSFSRVMGWVGGANRNVEVWFAPPGFVLRVDGCADIYIDHLGYSLNSFRVDKNFPDLDRQVMLGPALVFAMALRGFWCLHASAVMVQNKVFAFVGESGFGKSTLAASLASFPGNQLVADDILPVTDDPSSLLVWPHFPQLKLAVEKQPGLALPEKLTLDAIICLNPAVAKAQLQLKHLTPSEGLQNLLTHTAGTRLFHPELLSRHLIFCGDGAQKTQHFRLDYPHRKDVFPEILSLLSQYANS